MVISAPGPHPPSHSAPGAPFPLALAAAWSGQNPPVLRGRRWRCWAGCRWAKQVLTWGFTRPLVSRRPDMLVSRVGFTRSATEGRKYVILFVSGSPRGDLAVRRPPPPPSTPSTLPAPAGGPERLPRLAVPLRRRLRTVHPPRRSGPGWTRLRLGPADRPRANARGCHRPRNRRFGGGRCARRGARWIHDVRICGDPADLRAS